MKKLIPSGLWMLRIDVMTSSFNVLEAVYDQKVGLRCVYTMEKLMCDLCLWCPDLSYDQKVGSQLSVYGTPPIGSGHFYYFWTPNWMVDRVN